MQLRAPGDTYRRGRQRRIGPNEISHRPSIMAVAQNAKADDLITLRRHLSMAQSQIAYSFVILIRKLQTSPLSRAQLAYLRLESLSTNE
jgi:hypothetical protein